MTIEKASIWSNAGSCSSSGRGGNTGQFMQTCRRNFQTIGPAQRTGIDEKALEIGRLPQCVQKGARPGGQVSPRIEHTLRVSREINLQFESISQTDVEYFNHDQLLGFCPVARTAGRGSGTHVGSSKHRDKSSGLVRRATRQIWLS